MEKDFIVKYKENERTLSSDFTEKRSKPSPSAPRPFRSQEENNCCTDRPRKVRPNYKQNNMLSLFSDSFSPKIIL
jgi:hypothetical protein